MRLIGPSMQVFRNGNLDAAGTGDTSMHKADAIKERSQEVQFSIPVTVHQLLAAVKVAEICVESMGGLGTAISGITANDDGVAMVASMAPAPDRRRSHHHEGCDLVEHNVQGVSAKGSSMS